MSTEPNADAASLSQVEVAIRDYLRRADHTGAATLLLRSYGDELLGYLVNHLRDVELAREAFAMFAQDLWEGLPSTTLRTTARAWSYALARNAARHLLDREVRIQRRQLPLSVADELALQTAGMRSPTPVYLRTQEKLRVVELRARLTAEERELLGLRIDRGLSWHEIAVALEGDPEHLARRAARYRKRFQLIKRKLANWMREPAVKSDE